MTFYKTSQDKKGALKPGLLEMVAVEPSLLIKSLAQEYSFIPLRSTGSLRGKCLPLAPEDHK